jgi:dTMP kinase
LYILLIYEKERGVFMKQKKGLFITLEGVEGSGKTTAVQGIVEYFSDKYEIYSTREPGGSKIAEDIRKVILNPENTEMDPITEALLYAAARRQHFKEKVIPQLKMGKLVICDRFLDSSLAYQGYARKIGIKKVLSVNEFAVGNYMPDLTILLDLDPEIGLQRIRDNNREQNRLDMEELSFHRKVREGYLFLADKFPERFVVVDANVTKEELKKSVIQVVENFLAKN